MPPANHNIGALGTFRPAVSYTTTNTASSIGSNAVRESSYYAQEDRRPAPRPVEAQTEDNLLSDYIARSPPSFIVIRVSRSPVAAEAFGTSLTPNEEEKETDEGSKEDKEAPTHTPTRPTTMPQRKPYDGGGIVPPHIRTAIAESKNASTSATEAAKTPETTPAGKEIRAEEFTRSGFVPAYVLKNIATSEASTAEQRADAQGTLDTDEARRERGKDRDADGQGKK